MDITITLTDSEYKGLQYSAVDPLDWIENAAKVRAKTANDEIIRIYTNKALDEGVSIPLTREEIIIDAFTRGWVKTLAEIDNEMNANTA